MVLVFGTVRLIVLSLIVLTYIIVLSLVVSLINLVKFTEIYPIRNTKVIFLIGKLYKIQKFLYLNKEKF